MRLYKKFASNTIYQIVAKIASSGASFLITFFVARHFGVSLYGDFAKVAAYISIFYFFVDLGLNAVFLQDEKSSVRFQDLFYTRLGVACVIVLLANALAFFFPYQKHLDVGFSPEVKVSVLIFSITILTESVLYSASVVFQRKLIYEKVMIATIIGSLISLAGVGIVGIAHVSLPFIFGAYLIGAVAEAVIALVYTDESLFPIKVNPEFIKKLTARTLPVAIMLIFNLIYFRVDTILLSLFKSSIDVARYDIAYRIFDFLLALPLFLSNVLYPKLLLDEKNKRNANEKIGKYVLLFAGFGLLVTIPMWFISPYVFSFINKDLIFAQVPMKIFLLSLPIFFVTNILQWILLAKKKQFFLAWIYGVLMVANIILNLLFIPSYSYVASAIITDVLEVVAGCSMAILLFI